MLVCYSSSYRYSMECAYCFTSGDNNLLSNEVLQKVLSLTTPMTIILNGDWCCKTTLPETAHQVNRFKRRGCVTTVMVLMAGMPVPPADLPSELRLERDE
jgi:hypothetical protein